MFNENSDLDCDRFTYVFCYLKNIFLLQKQNKKFLTQSHKVPQHKRVVLITIMERATIQILVHKIFKCNQMLLKL